LKRYTEAPAGRRRSGRNDGNVAARRAPGPLIAHGGV